MSHQPYQHSLAALVVLQVESVFGQAGLERRLLQLIQPGQQTSYQTTGPGGHNHVGKDKPAVRFPFGRLRASEDAGRLGDHLPPPAKNVMQHPEREDAVGLRVVEGHGPGIHDAELDRLAEIG